MRILVLSDIHSNWVALDSIQEEFDHCICIGDLVDYGTDPGPCVEWVKDNANVTVRGNHDHAVAQRVQANGKTGFRRLAAATRPLHWDVLEPHHMKFLARLPVTTHEIVGDLRLFLVHATPWDPMDEYLTDNPEAWQQRLTGIDADIVCVGHSHVPFLLDLGDTKVLNPGSIGQPRDGDSRASYAIIEDGNITFHRQEYDIDECLDQMKKTNVDEWVIHLSDAVLRNGGRLQREQMDLIM